MATGQRNTYGVRRRWGGKMGVRVRVPGRKKWKVIARSQGNSGSKAKVTFERGQTAVYPTKLLPGQFKVTMPPGQVRYVESYP